MNTDLQDKLSKLLALTRSPEEHEAAAAAAKLASLLAKHNLDVADLEERGQIKAEVGEKAVDLAKAKWEWKLQLGRVLADHLYCIVLKRNGDPVFIGRPDNVDALLLLNTWLIGQIQEFARTARRAHYEETGMHIDPLRWQLSFGLGAVGRLEERLAERRQAEASKAGTALAVSHAKEASDYLEKTRGFRVDGQETALEREERERGERLRARWEKEHDDLLAMCTESGDMEPYYGQFPWKRPETKEQREARVAEKEKERAAERKLEERNAKRRKEREPEEPKPKSRKERVADLHRYHAQAAGEKAGDKLNLEPGIEDNNESAPESRRIK